MSFHPIHFSGRSIAKQLLAAGVALAIYAMPLANSRAFAATESREDLQESYLHYRQNRQSPFATAPLTHITPSRNTLTFGLAGDNYDLVIAPKEMNAQDPSGEEIHKLEVTGYTVAPVLAYSAKNYALGVTGEQGVREIHFLRDYTAIGGPFLEQRGEAKWSGAGLYGFLLMPQAMLPRVLQITIMAGSTFLKAEHRTDGERTAKDAQEAFRTYKYPVRRNELGVTGDLKLGRRFSLIIWYNYLTHKPGVAEITKADPGAEKVPPNATWDDRYDQTLELDQELLWQDQLRHRMGLDISYRLGKFEAHLGGVLGYLVARGTTPRHIDDNSLFLSFALSTGNR